MGSDNKTGEIIILWSRKQTSLFISIGDLWRALTKIERHDVQQHLEEQVNQDIQRYQRLIGNKISLEDQFEITRTRRDILTLEDITTVHEGKYLFSTDYGITGYGVSRQGIQN